MLKNILKILIMVIAVLVIAFDVLLYSFCERQKAELNSVKDKLDVEAEFNSNKFKFQEDQMDRLENDLQQAQEQIKSQDNALGEQKDALIQEMEKRQQVENDDKNVQTSLVDIKAETDAIKENMKGWQKDYVAVLAQFEKKMDDSQNEIKDLDDNFTANINTLKDDIEKITPAPAASVPAALSPDPEKPIDNSQTPPQ